MCGACCPLLRNPSAQFSLERPLHHQGHCLSAWKVKNDQGLAPLPGPHGSPAAPGSTRHIKSSPLLQFLPASVSPARVLSQVRLSVSLGRILLLSATHGCAGSCNHCSFDEPSTLQVRGGLRLPFHPLPSGASSGPKPPHSGQQRGSAVPYSATRTSCWGGHCHCTSALSPVGRLPEPDSMSSGAHAESCAGGIPVPRPPRKAEAYRPPAWSAQGRRRQWPPLPSTGASAPPQHPAPCSAWLLGSWGRDTMAPTHAQPLAWTPQGTSGHHRARAVSPRGTGTSSGDSTALVVVGPAAPAGGQVVTGPGNDSLPASGGAELRERQRSQGRAVFVCSY